MEVALKRLREPLPIALLSALIAVLIATVSLVATGGLPRVGHPVDRSSVPTNSSTTGRLAAGPVLAAAADDPLPTAAALSKALTPGLADPAFGGGLAGIVLGADGSPRFSRAAGTPLPPASTAKLVTAVAALAALGPTARLTTTVVRGGAAVVLVGGGDPTLASPAALRATPGLASLDALAASTARALRAARVTAVSVAYDGSRFSGPLLGPGWKPGYVREGDVAPVTALMVDGGRVRPDRRARYPDPAAAAARAFGARLAAHGITVRGAPRPAPTVASATAPLAAVSSPPVAALVARMLTTSDNDLAEALGREVAGKLGLPRSFTGAAAGIQRAVAAVGAAPPDPAASGLALADASGLSPQDRATPRALARLLVAASDHPQLHGLFSGLPIAGFSGTLADRFRRGPAAAAAGLVRAKTGALNSVSALAGTVVDRDGTILIFTFLAPRPTSRSRAEAALDRLAATLAGL